MEKDGPLIVGASSIEKLSTPSPRVGLLIWFIQSKTGTRNEFRQKIMHVTKTASLGSKSVEGLSVRFGEEASSLLGSYGKHRVIRLGKV